MAGRLLTLGQVAERVGVPTWKVQRLFERGLLPAPQKVGVYRVIPEGELARVREALVKAGYLPDGRE